jgi:hypothetical protein
MDQNVSSPGTVSQVVEHLFRVDPTNLASLLKVRRMFEFPRNELPHGKQISIDQAGAENANQAT